MRFFEPLRQIELLGNTRKEFAWNVNECWIELDTYQELCHIQKMKEDHQLLPISKDAATNPI